MGMIWNSPATVDMIRQVNVQFSGDNGLSARHGGTSWSPPIRYWQQPVIRDQFNGTTRKNLTNIATDNDVTSPLQNSNWMAWLANLGDHAHGSSPHEKLRAAIYKGLNSNKYSEIVFAISPLPDKDKVKVTWDEIGGTFLITVQTPTYDQMAQSVRRTARRRAKKKAANKKKL
jgi:hypothetical protein